MSQRKPHRVYYWGTILTLSGSFIAAEAAVVYANSRQPLWDAQNQDQPALLLLLLMPLALLLLPLFMRALDAQKAALPPTQVHQALAPERVFILSCWLFTLATALSFAAEFDGTIWGVLLSVTIVAPLLSYAQHVGELRIALKQAQSAAMRTSRQQRYARRTGRTRHLGQI